MTEERVAMGDYTTKYAHTFVLFSVSKLSFIPKIVVITQDLIFCLTLYQDINTELFRQLLTLNSGAAHDQRGRFMTYSFTGSSRFFLISFSLTSFSLLLGWKKELIWRMQGDEPPNKSTIIVLDQAMMEDMNTPNFGDNF